ncbi:interferon-induced GTP-binding protein Mx2 [Pyricularia oryzae Y34]|uniref:Interferon-induced GTP-binding protein Mx2 n=1 Tax=Pyricularia oryzae (strain Y34) TaxID=1143189 RepID=A0AA97P2V0_PYRO3|nr:interferon-induced GTP-binding protein Mx2 [Pyricularia oryzae Y34]
MGDAREACPSQLINLGSTLEGLQGNQQRLLLDTVSQVRKCGLGGILSLPQIVVCGDQSAGKSSVLEALTEIPFPRSDNLCTRFATEISLRREAQEKITVKIVPSCTRSKQEQVSIKAFSESITSLSDLPRIMDAAMKIMGISLSNNTPSVSAFASDTLSIEIDGPNRPQLTLVDIPGLIQASTKGVSENDVATVKEITDRYISQHRTICLAVISATNDAANQGILQQVRKFDPKGERTLGVITKPDKLEAGSGSEAKFIELARNQDVFFELGWHVVKNRMFSEQDFSFEERNTSEMNFFSQLSMDCHEICKAASNGHYEHEYFKVKDGGDFTFTKKSTISRLRAAVQHWNNKFSEDIRTEGHKYRISRVDPGELDPIDITEEGFGKSNKGPKRMSKAEAYSWVKGVVLRSRGTELFGSFNPHVVAELFWEQSQPWAELANAHVDLICDICESFLTHLLETKGAKDVTPRIWSIIKNRLQQRRAAAHDELRKLLEDLKGFPINYNHYYTDNLHKSRQEKLKSHLKAGKPGYFEHHASMNCSRGLHYEKFDVATVVGMVSTICTKANADMEDFSCEEAIECLLAIYKKVFVANVTTQVIERQILRGLDHVFSPPVVAGMSDAEVISVALEGATVQNQRRFLLDRISKLEEGRDIFRTTQRLQTPKYPRSFTRLSSSEMQKLFSFSHFSAPQRKCDIRMLLIQW